jgi:hypothetical protein
MKSKSIFLFVELSFILILFSGCTGFVKSDEKKISSFPINNLQIIYSGELKYHDCKWKLIYFSPSENVEPSASELVVQCDNHSITHEKVNDDIYGKWKGIIKTDTIEKKIQINYTVDGDGSGGYNIILEEIIINLGKFKISRIRNFAIDSFPYKFTDFFIDNNRFSVYAIVEDLWVPWSLFSDKNNEETLQKKWSSFNSVQDALFRKDQQFQILNSEGIVVAEFLNDKYTIYNSVKVEEINQIKVSIGVLKSVIEVAGRRGAPDPVFKNRKKDNPPKTLF